MSFRSLRNSRLTLFAPAFLILLASAWPAHAVQFTSSQVGPTTWKYDVTFDPLDNYSIFQTNTTITLTGVSGVTAASGPTSTDFTDAGNTVNLAWTAQVLDGGTRVVWTHVGPGTGNWPIAKHAYGFSVTAASARNGTVSFATSGFAKDTTNGGNNVDISGTIAGPVGGTAPPPAAPVPPTLVMTLVGLGSFGVYYVRRRR